MSLPAHKLPVHHLRRSTHSLQSTSFRNRCLICAVCNPPIAQRFSLRRSILTSSRTCFIWDEPSFRPLFHVQVWQQLAVALRRDRVLIPTWITPLSPSTSAELRGSNAPAWLLLGSVVSGELIIHFRISNLQMLLMNLNSCVRNENHHIRGDSFESNSGLSVRNRKLCNLLSSGSYSKCSIP